jgi:hypothetical protein
MPRCWLLITVLTLLSCGTSLGPPAYPRSVAGGYRLHRENVLASDQLPKGVPSAGLVRAVQLVYDASNTIQLTVFETKSHGVALEAMQKWRTQAGTQAALFGRYFVIAQSEKPDPAGMRAFLADFEKQLR